MKRTKNKSTSSRKREIRAFNSMQDADKADRLYWWSRTPAQRMRELERLRQLNWDYGQGKPFPRFKELFESLNSARS